MAGLRVIVAAERKLYERVTAILRQANSGSNSGHGTDAGHTLSKLDEDDEDPAYAHES
jgi:hypothetical protein